VALRVQTLEHESERLGYLERHPESLIRGKTEENQ
jgi:hypothetical protein